MLSFILFLLDGELLLTAPKLLPSSAPGNCQNNNKKKQNSPKWKQTPTSGTDYALNGTHWRHWNTSRRWGGGV